MVVTEVPVMMFVIGIQLQRGLVGSLSKDRARTEADDENATETGVTRAHRSPPTPSGAGNVRRLAALGGQSACVDYALKKTQLTCKS
jgi:hypothetical protein